jgi:hypothetical protein
VAAKRHDKYSGSSGTGRSEGTAVYIAKVGELVGEGRCEIQQQ